MTTREEEKQAVVTSVISDAKWIVWHTSDPEERAIVRSLLDRGAQWYAMGTGWVGLMNLDKEIGNSVLVDTQVARWAFCVGEEESVWRGPRSWDWREAWGWKIGTPYDRHSIKEV